jgi:hypothetical protein
LWGLADSYHRVVKLRVKSEEFATACVYRWPHTFHEDVSLCRFPA